LSGRRAKGNQFETEIKIQDTDLPTS